MVQQFTIALVKPDGVAQGLVPAILKIFEENGLAVMAQKETCPTPEMVQTHLNYKESYTQEVGEKVLGLCTFKGIDVTGSFLEKKTPYEVGLIFKDYMADYLLSGPSVAFILKGEEAIARTKELCGSTFPADAKKDSIRGRYGKDSLENCVAEQRSVYNIVHAADSVQEAECQIGVWFPEFCLKTVQQVNGNGHVPKHNPV